GDERHPQQGDRHRLPGADDLAQPGLHRGRADRRGDPPTRGPRPVRGDRLSMIFQEPMTSRNPVARVGDQVGEPLVLHRGASRKEARARAVDLLRKVGIADPERRVLAYPHELSGGMRQRVMIAMALSCDPELLIADEPTTALDVTIQAQILDLMNDLQKRLNSAIILITHDLGVVAEVCEKVLVMYGGTMVEYGTAEQIFAAPKHPYTLGLLESLPRLDERRRLVPIEGQPPNLLRLPAGCVFAPRCPYALPDHAVNPPPIVDFGGGHVARCTLYKEEPGLDIRLEADRLKLASASAKEAARG
ncbi:MAG: ABC transporter ATP-binding protein, partial [Candidatus Eremiobacteraeota bacterium]|nr:ABC transporter ATP-binding protein [Candidatus Eremiobacteraeota bacterium]